jgi:hypothetical protein
MTTIYMGQVALGPFLWSVLLRLILFRRNALIPVVDNFLAVISIPVAIFRICFNVSLIAAILMVSTCNYIPR